MTVYFACKALLTHEPLTDLSFKLMLRTYRYTYAKFDDQF